MNAQTWVEIEAYNNPGPLGYSDQVTATLGLSGAKGEQRRTEKLVEGRWIVRWWKRIR